MVISAAMAPMPQHKFCAPAISNRRRFVHTLLAATLPLPRPAEGRSEDDDGELRTMRLFEKATRSVVSVELGSPDEDEGGLIHGTGSGFVWDSFGHIVTNYHVVQKLGSSSSSKQRPRVSLLSEHGRVARFEALVVGVDASEDLAVLKVELPDAFPLHPAMLGASAHLKVGQACYAIGNPYGLDHTLTTGVVSGLGRQIPSPAGKPILGAIQTDASINAGNSGGPLLDSFGRVIGVSTATYTRRGSGISSGVNFAIAIDVVRHVVPRLIVQSEK